MEEDGDNKEFFDVFGLLSDFEKKINNIAFIGRDSERIKKPLGDLIRLFEKAKYKFENQKVDYKKGEQVEKPDLNDWLDWHETHKAGRELWCKLISAALYDIDPQAKGNSRLFKYLDAATEFEDLLYGLEKHYRDHTLHSLWVYLIGVRLMSKDGPLEEIGNNLNWYLYNDIKYGSDKSFYPKCLKIWSGFKKRYINKQVQKHRDAIWCIIALCHDLGYSLAKLGDLNKKVQKVLEFYHVSDFRRLGYSLDIEQQYLTTQILELMAMDVRIVPGDNYGEIEDKVLEIIKLSEGDKSAGKNKTKENKTEESTENNVQSIIDSFLEPKEELSKEAAISPDTKTDSDDETLWDYLKQEIKPDKDKIRQLVVEEIEKETSIKCYRDDSTYWRLCKALERKEHGILSSYLLYKTLGIFADTSVRGPAEDWGLDDEEVIYNIIRGDILFAIAQHEFAYAHIDQLGSLAEILILCDELEEFSRLGRQLQSRKYHDTAAEAKVDIDPIDENDKISADKRIVIKIEYKSNHENLSEYYGFVARKAERMCTLYSLNQKRGQDDVLYYPIKKIEVKFNWEDHTDTENINEIKFEMCKNEKDSDKEFEGSLPGVNAKVNEIYKITEEYESSGFTKCPKDEKYDGRRNQCKNCEYKDICTTKRECEKCKKCKSKENGQNNNSEYDLVCHDDKIKILTECKKNILLKKWLGVSENN